MTTKAEITVARDALAPALGRAVPLAVPRLTIPVMSRLRVEWNAHGLSLTASNFDCWFSETLPAPTGGPWAGCVDAHRLNGFVQSLPKGTEVRLIARDDMTLTIAGGGAEACFLTLPADHFPRFMARPDEVTAVLELAAEALAAALRFCLPHVGVDKVVRYYYCGVLFDPAGFAVGLPRSP
jgi:DNA polymerase III sliding clamp (beta) subunit (PCNA family)